MLKSAASVLKSSGCDLLKNVTASIAPSMSGCEKLFNEISYVTNHVVGDFRINRQRQNSRLIGVGHRKIRRLVSEVSISRIKWQRLRIIQDGSDFFFTKKFFQSVPLFRPDNVKMINVVAFRRDFRTNDIACSAQKF